MCDWIELEKQKPSEDSKYLVYAPSADPGKPLIAISWYNPETGWSLLPQVWLDAITHWQKLKPPCPSSLTLKALTS